jgi:MFS family permease
MVMEHAPVDRRGFIGSIVSTGSPISQVLANLLLVLLTTVLSEQQWESWGWRVPFLASIAIVAVAAYIRLKLTETPAFVAAKEVKSADEAHQSSGLRVLRAHPKEVTQLILSWGGMLACFYLVTVYGLSVMKSQGGMASNTTFLILVIGAACAVPACVFGGWASDRIGRKKTVLIALAGCATGMALFFSVMSTGSAWLVGIAVIVTLCSTQFASGAQPALFAEQFPTRYRFSGSALSITFSNVLFSAPAPFVASALADAFGTYAVLALVIGLLIVSALAVASIVERSDVDLVDFRSDAPEPPAGEQNSATQDLSEAR